MSIQFDSTELENATYIPRFAKHESAPDRTISSLAPAREDGEIIIAERYGKKVVQLQGALIGSTQADLESKIDAFKELLSRVEKNLDISWNGSTRRYVATCTRHTFDRDYFNINMVPWTAEFTVLSGEGKDTSLTVPAAADGTSGTQLVSDPSSTPTYGEATVSILGGKPPKPKITISHMDAGSAVRGFEYKNVTTGQIVQVTYDGSWGNSRTVTIDCDTKTVSGDVVTGAVHNMNLYGTFPAFVLGNNVIDVQMGGMVNQKSADDSAADLSTSQVVISSTNDRKAQSFMVPYTDATFQGVTIYVQKQGTPGTLRWEIQTDNAGAPSGTLVDAANSKGTFSGISTSNAYVYSESTSTAPFTLSANTVYWLVLKADATLDSSNRYFLTFAGDGLTGNASYPRGRSRYSTDGASTWLDFTYKSDLSFRIHYGGRRATMVFYHKIEYYKTYL